MRPLLDLLQAEAALKPLPKTYPPSNAVVAGLASGTPAAITTIAPAIIAIKATCMAVAGTATAASMVSLGLCGPGGCACCRRGTATATIAWCGRPDETNSREEDSPPSQSSKTITVAPWNPVNSVTPLNQCHDTTSLPAAEHYATGRSSATGFAA